MMETMESSFYHDTGIMKKAMLKKSEMHLDFNNQSLMKSKQKKLSEAILNSPDVNLLKLASPELERMIIQQGAITTTPTPTTQILFPRSVTEEQEAYARGFVDALAELHQTPEQGEESGALNIAELPQSSTYTTLTTLSSANSTANQFTNAISSGRVPTNSLVKSSVAVGPSTSGFPAYTTVTQLPGSVLSQNAPVTTMSTLTASVPSNGAAMGINSQEILVHNQPMTAPRNQSPAMQFSTSSGQHSQLMQIKSEEPQRVPSLSPQLTPINMVAQEGIKLERKRARNRVAARKCRTRKLERISRLEDRVNELKGQNTTLVQTASDLREQVFKLKQQILEHVDSGCKVMLSANML